MRIEIPVYDGFDEIDAFGPFEVLSSAGFEVAIVAAYQPGPVTSMRGVRLLLEGSWAQVQRGVLPARLAELAGSARWIASVCTGAMLLAAGGLLTDRYATTNHNALDELRPYVLEVVEERVVDDGDVITAGGLTAGLDLGLWITERQLGTAAADRVARSIEYPRQGRVWRGPAR